MAIIESHNPGALTWLELATSDQNAAKSFYSTLFGWGIDDQDMGPAGVYTMFTVEGRNVAAAYTQSPQEAAMVPPHWNLYIAVENADASAAKAVELGGTVVMGPFNAGEFGRMAVLVDPTGAAFCIWQAITNHGIGLSGVEGTLCWADVFAGHGESAEAKAATFYSALFGYEIVPGDGGYTHLKNGSEMIGGIQASAHVPPGVPPHWLAYILVGDCAVVTGKAAGLGAAVILPPMEIEKTGFMSVIKDPQGAMIALFQPFPRG